MAYSSSLEHDTASSLSLTRNMKIKHILCIYVYLQMFSTKAEHRQCSRIEYVNLD